MAKKIVEEALVLLKQTWWRRNESLASDYNEVQLHDHVRLGDPERGGTSSDDRTKDETRRAERYNNEV